MNGISKKQLIQKEKLSKSHFFEHLIMTLEEEHLLSEEECQDIQMQLIGVLAEDIDAYYHGQGSSIPRQKAEVLMASVYYALSVYFRELDDIDESAGLLRENTMKELVERGRQIMADKVNTCQSLYERLKREQLTTANIAYTHTINEGIAPFFSSYDMRFGGNESGADIDYPLCLDKMQETGIIYMEGYLRKALLENDFCRFFADEEIEAVLKAYHRGYEHLLLNIFEHVLLNAIGCTLLGKVGLKLNKKDEDTLYEKLQFMDDQALMLCISGAAKELMDRLGVQNEEMRQYIFRAGSKWQPVVVNAIEIGDMSEIFAIEKQTEEEKVSVIGGEKLSDEDFKQLTEEIRDCHEVQDKIKWIREKITHEEDLRDVLEADCIFEEEFDFIFEQLSDMELAILIRFNMMDEFGTIDLGQQSDMDPIWYARLRSYLMGLEEKKRKAVLHIAQRIK